MSPASKTSRKMTDRKSLGRVACRQTIREVFYARAQNMIHDPVRVTIGSFEGKSTFSSNIAWVIACGKDFTHLHNTKQTGRQWPLGATVLGPSWTLSLSQMASWYSAVQTPNLDTLCATPLIGFLGWWALTQTHMSFCPARLVLTGPCHPQQPLEP